MSTHAFIVLPARFSRTTDSGKLRSLATSRGRSANFAAKSLTDTIDQRNLLEPQILCSGTFDGTQTHICPMVRAKNSLVRGSSVFSEKGNLFQNHLRYKHFSRIHPQDRCKVRHFRDSEKRLPCGIRTVALRHRSRKNSRFFQKTGANLPPCLAITPIERNGIA